MIYANIENREDVRLPFFLFLFLQYLFFYDTCFSRILAMAKKSVKSKTAVRFRLVSSEGGHGKGTMKLTVDTPAVRNLLFEGSFGLEKESLRVMKDTGLFAKTPHPFSNPLIVQDFAENQTEINTKVCSSWKEARKACEEMTIAMLQKLDLQNEVLWPFSNPAPIRNEADIPMLESGSNEAIAYRRYLNRRYGKYKMVYSGIHYNFAFSDAMLAEQYRLDQPGISFQAFKDAFYLDLCQKILRYGWIIDVLLNASPIYDGSLFAEEDLGKTGFSGMSSMRNSALGYWNFFTPYLDYSSIEAYTGSIETYVDSGLLKAPRELYYPVRIKPAGAYSLEALVRDGISHIELRMVDLNPYELSGISEADAAFCHLFLIYLAAHDFEPLSWKDQIYAAQNFKNASFYSIEQARILQAGKPALSVLEASEQLLQAMQDFFAPIDEQAAALIRKQQAMLNHPQILRKCEQVRRDFADFGRQGLEQAIWLQRKALANCSDLLILEEKGSI